MKKQFNQKIVFLNIFLREKSHLNFIDLFFTSFYLICEVSYQDSKFSFRKRLPTLTFKHSLTFAFLLDEINIYFIALCGFLFLKCRPNFLFELLYFF